VFHVASNEIDGGVAFMSVQNENSEIRTLGLSLPLSLVAGSK